MGSRQEQRAVELKAAPRAAGSCNDVRPSDATGALLTAVTCALTAAGILLAAQDAFVVWLCGQGILALAFVQWFVLLHEAGHGTLYRARALNPIAGHLAALFALIPFESWRRVHGLHHLWTGWQDLDPTTANLAPRPRSRLQCVAVDIAWRTGLPLFSVVYRIGNYWSIARLAAVFVETRARRRLIANGAALVVLYALLIWALGVAEALRIFGLALLLGLALQDPLILSQHIHIPQRLSHGRSVEPLSPAEQVRYTRSLQFPQWVSRWLLFGFDAHELHHRFPAVPGYRLRRIDHASPNEVNWWSWLVAAKRLRGSVLLFENGETTGFRR